MLVDFESGNVITKIPYEDEYRTAMSRLTADEIAAVKTELNSKIDGDEIHTAGWMPGSDWTDTQFQPIYEKAAQHNPDLAARLFGIVVWEVFMERPERWYSGRFELGGEEIGSRTYFRERE